MTREPKQTKAEDLTYNDYLKVPELLQLQQPLSDPFHHDEMLFIVIHQVYELWFKVILKELGYARDLMRDYQVLNAQHHVHRSVEILKVLVSQIHILETMTPVDFLAFRDRINPASGFQSLQFRELEFFLGLRDERYFHFFANRPEVIARLKAQMAEPDFPTEFYEMLRGIGIQLPADVRRIEESGTPEEKAKVFKVLDPLFRKKESFLPVYLLCESLVELDEFLSIWRFHHARAVERVIGNRMGTGGSSGVSYLESTLNKRCFSLLWEIRTHLQK